MSAAFALARPRLDARCAAPRLLEPEDLADPRPAPHAADPVNDWLVCEACDGRREANGDPCRLCAGKGGWLGEPDDEDPIYG